MTSTIVLVRFLPWALLGRLATAFVEVTAAVAILSGSVIVGHELRGWRDWYWDPATTHPWAPTARPTEPAAAAPTPATPVAAPPLSIAARLVVTPAPACSPSTGSELLAFVNPVASGADCVWLRQQPDGTHLVVGTSGSGTSDLGIVETAPTGPRSFGMQYGTKLDVYSPAAWGSPVVTVVGPAGADLTVLVFTWQSRHLMPLLRVGGPSIHVTADASGWPRVSIDRPDGARTYAWDGRGFSQR